MRAAARPPDDLGAALEAARRALREAPDKRRIDFPPYWDWYDRVRTPALAALDERAPNLPD
ncbi:MAG TPA: hypothetical protein VNK50_13075 [Calidithermus sp.]|nr:hypothetical protein [Calidithermus sp.]